MDLHMHNKAYGRQIYTRVMSEACVYSTHLDHDVRSGVTLVHIAPEFPTVTVLRQGPSDDPVRLDHWMGR